MAANDTGDVPDEGREASPPSTESGSSLESAIAAGGPEPEPGLERERLGLRGIVARIVTAVRNLGGNEEALTAEAETKSDSADDEGDQELSEEAARAEAVLPPIVKLVNLILLEALRKGATRIYFETSHGKFTVTFLVGNSLEVGMTPPYMLSPAVTKRVKEIARLDPDLCRFEQEGQIALEVGPHRRAGFSVLTIPTVYGNDLVLEVLYDQPLLSICD